MKQLAMARSLDSSGYSSDIKLSVAAQGIRQKTPGLVTRIGRSGFIAE
jgi:hypothetical protein